VEKTKENPKKTRGGLKMAHEGVICCEVGYILMVSPPQWQTEESKMGVAIMKRKSDMRELSEDRGGAERTSCTLLREELGAGTDSSGS